MRGFFVRFSLLLTALFVLEWLPSVQAAVVVPFTNSVATLSGWLIQLWDARVLTQENLIWNRENGFAVSIEAGCNGVEESIALVAAMVAYPASWRDRLIGLAGGVLTVQVLNLLRIITLFYLGQWHQTFFEWAHLYAWQALIMLDVLLVFLFWLHWIRPPRTQPGGAIA
ncbi:MULTISPECIES: exosortase H [Thiorhodovibrio]|uniref:exosortase H n=1 Tax=Thiorhodovibrio TaxID=61593 RepID=UPI001912D688|nr:MULTISPECIES: exosortase H [Thiorhodovibrio]MBK5967620.1 exosortase H [Thiorhodovibrio winogradskyi]WPL13075.1 exosortase H, IPTLxxWG-CTERM-specific [Thiorhodovibrio litoralis]